MSFATLAADMLDGSTSAGQQLCERLARPMLTMLTQRTQDRPLAEDLTQEALIVVLARLRDGGIDDLATLPGFARQTALNLLANWSRKEARRRTDADTDVVEAVSQASADPLQQLLQTDRNALLRQLIDELPKARDRRILERLYIWGFDKDRICGELGLAPADVDRIASRARQRLLALAERRRGEL